MNSESNQSIAILGATGSIGESALSVISLHPDKFSIFALCANENVKVLFSLCQQYQPKYAVLADTDAAAQLQDLLTHEKLSTEVLGGAGALDQIAGHTEVDIVIAAITGAAGLSSTLAAANAGKKILLANKESLVIAGHFLLDAVHMNNAQLIPLDSEHNAIFQCHPVSQAGHKIGDSDDTVAKILLTASGGPFLSTSLDTFDSITVDEACAHPRWKMGKKISIDSATMMNKGLELIEACLLFGVSPEQVQIVIHPQSVIHSMVEYEDGSVLAQMGNTDMRIPIAHALAYPDRIRSGVKEFNIFDIARLDFAPPCEKRFPALALARLAAQEANVLPTIMNAANEICVRAFIQEQIKFTQISEIVGKLMHALGNETVKSLSDIIELDQRTRVATQAFLN
jgi:1-deoxy-D-xylulose-5-phosphate reductoisomerase